MSHNGVHLIPINQIQVRSNGKTLKVVLRQSHFYLLWDFAFIDPAIYSRIALRPIKLLLRLLLGVNLKLVIEENDFSSQGNSNKNNSNNNNVEEVTNSNKYELFIERLCHPVVNLSYTIQPDMVTILLRKKTEKTWKELQMQAEKLIKSAAQVYV